MVMIEGIDPDEHLVLVHHLLNTVKGKGALQEGRLLAGDLVGLEGQLGGNTVVAPGKIYHVSTGDHVDDLFVNLCRQHLFSLFRCFLQSCHLFAPKVTQQRIVKECLLYHRLSGSNGILLAAAQNVCRVGKLFKLGVFVGREAEDSIVLFLFQGGDQSYHLLGLPGVGGGKDRKVAEVIVECLSAPFSYHRHDKIFLQR